jgi:DNA repair protein RadC
MKQLRERLYAYGSETLLTEELLAIILRGSPREQVLELASRLLVKYGGLGGLLHADCRELNQEQGLGEARIALIKAALEMGKRLYTRPSGDKYQITMEESRCKTPLPHQGAQRVSQATDCFWSRNSPCHRFAPI